MSVVSFNYWDIEDSIKKAKKTASYLSDYVSDMNSIVRSCNSLPGSDSYGYVDQAVELVKKKVSHANKVKNAYTAYASELDALERKAEAADLAVEKNINVTVSDYVGKRSLGQAIGDCIYNRYLLFLDRVSNLPLVGDYLAQGIRMAGNWVLDMTGQAYNWFKYGDGKYVWNIVTAVTGVLVAAAGVVAAVVAIGAAAVPVLAVIAAVGAVAGMIALVLKFGDMMASVEQNAKALELSGEYRKSTKDKDEWWDTEDDQGSITAARYYGSVTGVKDWIDKTDFGGKTANGILGVTGSVYSWVEHAAETTSAVCTLIVGLGNAQYMKAPDGEWARYKPPKGVKSKTAKPDGSFFQNIKAANQEKALKAGNVIKKDGSFFQNVKTAYLEKAGVVYKRTPVSKKYSVRNGQLQIAKYDYSKVLKIKFFEGYGKTFEKAGIDSVILQGIYSGAKMVKNVDGLASDMETISEFDRGKSRDFSGAQETAKAAVKTAENIGFMSALHGDASKSQGLVVDMGKDIIDLFTPSKNENAYQAYLDSIKAAT